LVDHRSPQKGQNMGYCFSFGTNHVLDMPRIALLNAHAKQETLMPLEESNDTWGWQTFTLDTAKV
jgi:hypothetical protein